MKRTGRIALLLSLVAVSPCLHAQHGEAVFLSGNRNPFIDIHGVPAPAAAAVAPAGQWRSAWSFELANNSIGRDNTDERLVIDGESYRLAFDARYGLGQGFDLGLNVPLISHQRGAFDNLIWEWHELYGFSNEKRKDFRHRQLRYAYESGGGTRIDMDHPESGLGDVRLSAGWSLADEGGWLMAVRTGIKLATGDEDRLLGSGGTDLSLQVSGAMAGVPSESGEFFWSMGVLRLGSGGTLEDRRRDWVPLGSLGLEQPLPWPRMRRLAFKLQIDVHGPFYRSEISAIGGPGVQLLTGGSVAIGERGKIDFAIVEDLVSGATPDFGLYLAWRGYH